MRLIGLAIVAAMVVPAVAGAQPESTEPTADADAPADAAPDDMDYSPTSSKAPDGADEIPDTDLADEPTSPADAAEPTEPESDLANEDLSLEDERAAQAVEERKRARKKQFNRHGVGVRGGIVVIPTWILHRFLATHTNALCRGEKIGGFADDRGLIKQDGCNFYVGGEYVYRQSRVLDIVGSVGYQHLHSPDGYWLDESECVTGTCNLAGADYTEIKLGIVYLEADFIARAPIVVTNDFEFDLGGGAGVGLGIMVGNVWRTAIGANPQGATDDGLGQNTCNTVEDLADTTRCTPRYDVDEAPEGSTPLPPNQPNAGGFATCGKDTCSTGDLNQFGYRDKEDDVPPVIPVVNLMLSARFIIKDTFGISLNGGFNSGFYFGGAMHYFFGKNLKTRKKKK